jgi:hypothetical protein
MKADPILAAFRPESFRLCAAKPQLPLALPAQAASPAQQVSGTFLSTPCSHS